jgi:peptidoglycan/LPS O-acetylase OafA/YrhL
LEPRTGHVPELDGIRGLAAFAVLCAHTLPRRAPGGFIGVDVFFVLSGYLITAILAREFEGRGAISLPRFYARRALRLLPALFLMLAVFLAVVLTAKLALGNDPFAREQGLAALSAGLYFMNWTRAFNLGPEGWLGHTWSLAIEEQFYLLWPWVLLFVLVRCGRRHAWIAVLLLLVLSTSWRLTLLFSGSSPERVYNGFDTRIDMLLMGCLLALAPLRSLQGAAAASWWAPAGLFAGIFLYIPWNTRPLQLWGYTTIAIAAAWLILAATDQGAPGFFRKFLAWRPLVYCGRISYGIYLWHYPISCALHERMGGWRLFLATMATTLGVSSCSWFLLERPLLRLKERFAASPSAPASDRV